jgi:hypothetical protein
MKLTSAQQNIKDKVVIEIEMDMATREVNAEANLVKMNQECDYHEKSVLNFLPRYFWTKIHRFIL